jgi:glycosyltransferase involved in cell wall biosynthesis
MNLLCLTTSYPRSESDDSSVFVKRLCIAIRSQVDALIVITPSEITVPPETDGNGITVERVRYWPVETRLTYGAGLLENIKQNSVRVLLLLPLILSFAFHGIRLRKRYDIIHANWIIAGAAALIVRLLIGKPYVLTLRGSEMMLIKNPYVRFFYGPILFGAKAITTVSESLRSELVEYYPSLGPSTHSIPNGVGQFAPSDIEISQFCERYKLSRTTAYIVAVGSVIPRKRIEKLLVLMAHPGLSTIHLLVAGKLDQAEYAEQVQGAAESLGLGERVHFLGPVEPQQVGCAFAISRALISASSFEGRPNAILEAMAFGLPIIASDIPAHREIINDGQNGILVSFEDIPGAVAKIGEVLTNRELKKKFAEWNHMLTHENTWKRCAERYVELFYSALSTPTAPIPVE